VTVSVFGVFPVLQGAKHVRQVPEICPD
jgi:hypothetical protein